MKIHFKVFIIFSFVLVTSASAQLGRRSSCNTIDQCTREIDNAQAAILAAQARLQILRQAEAIRRSTPVLSDVVISGSQTREYCPDASNGEVCYMPLNTITLGGRTIRGANEYCAQRGDHLPYIRELVQSMNPAAIRDTFERGRTTRIYDEAGNVDFYYFEDTGSYIRPIGNLGENRFWSSSRVSSDPDRNYIFDSVGHGNDPGSIYSLDREGANGFAAVRCATGSIPRPN